MGTASASTLQGQLAHRRERLQEAIAAAADGAEDLVLLLREVDAALARLDAGTLGTCEICQETIDERDLEANPLLRYCLCDLTPEQQRALESDLELAARIQNGLLPEQDLGHGGWEAHYRYLPAGVVSGDYCDLIRPSGDPALYFALGDVSGKGVAASLLMAHLNASFRTLTESSPKVCHLIERANRLLLESTLPSHYATLVCGRALPDGTVEMSNAGHCQPLWLRAGRNECVPVESSGPPIGLFRDEVYSFRSIQLEPGDLLFLYTDGLSESRDRRGSEYGAERVMRLLRERWGSVPRLRDLGAACLQDLFEFTTGVPRIDDLTILALGRTAGS